MSNYVYMCIDFFDKLHFYFQRLTPNSLRSVMIKQHYFRLIWKNNIVPVSGGSEMYSVANLNLFLTFYALLLEVSLPNFTVGIRFLFSRAVRGLRQTLYCSSWWNNILFVSSEKITSSQYSGGREMYSVANLNLFLTYYADNRGVFPATLEEFLCFWRAFLMVSLETRNPMSFSLEELILSYWIADYHKRF